MDQHGQYWSDKFGPQSILVADTGVPLLDSIVAAHEMGRHAIDNILGGGPSETDRARTGFASVDRRDRRVNAFMDHLAGTEAAKKLLAEAKRVGNAKEKHYDTIRYLARPDEMFARGVEQLAARALGTPEKVAPHLDYGRPKLTLLQPHELDQSEQLFRSIFQ